MTLTNLPFPMLFWLAASITGVFGLLSIALTVMGFAQADLSTILKLWTRCFVVVAGAWVLWCGALVVRFVLEEGRLPAAVLFPGIMLSMIVVLCSVFLVWNAGPEDKALRQPWVSNLLLTILILTLIAGFGSFIYLLAGSELFLQLRDFIVETPEEVMAESKYGAR
jgi:hypothetical protein